MEELRNAYDDEASSPESSTHPVLPAKTSPNRLHDPMGDRYANPGVSKRKLKRTFLESQHQGCDIPVKTFFGHHKEVSTIRFLPRSGQILSASRDNTVKLWDLGRSAKPRMTYRGHFEAVQDLCIYEDGKRFVTASEDKRITVWDIETGRVELSIRTEHITNVVKLKPSEHNQSILLAGMSDNKIVQWDLASRSVVQQYDQHKGAVNTVEFLDNGKRFVSTSKDESLRVWEFGVNKTLKYACEPHIGSTYSTSVHPSGKWLSTQSSDKQVRVYNMEYDKRFQLIEGKRYIGHDIGTSACQISFSPDGQYIISGDSMGKLWIWDWDTCQAAKTLQCHNGVCAGAAWHPEQDFVATCSSDKTVKYWHIGDVCRGRGEEREKESE